jgi:hypothetical protein
MISKKTYTIDLILVLILTFFLIGYHKYYDDSSDLNTNTNQTINSQLELEANNSITLKYPNNSLRKSFERIGWADNTKLILRRDNFSIVCASDYTLLGTFPKRDEYSSYKCTQQPCNAEVASIEVLNSGDVFAKLENKKSGSSVELKNNRTFSLSRITQAICVPKNQLNHWEVAKKWYEF